MRITSGKMDRFLYNEDLYSILFLFTFLKKWHSTRKRQTYRVISQNIQRILTYSSYQGTEIRWNGDKCSKHWQIKRGLSRVCKKRQNNMSLQSTSFKKKVRLGIIMVMFRIMITIMVREMKKIDNNLKGHHTLGKKQKALTFLLWLNKKRNERNDEHSSKSYLLVFV